MPRTGVVSKILNKLGIEINPATEDKQDDIISAVGDVTSNSKWFVNDILENGTDTYFGKEDKDGNWLFMKIDTNNNFSYATVTNNSSITSYSSAKTNYLTLTYGNYSTAL